MNKPVIKLLEIGGCSPETFSKVWVVAKDNTPYEEIQPLEPELLDKFMATDIPTQEYINMIWVIEGMPRAFWDQLDRCRLASFWEQSARVLDHSDFAEKKRYWTSDNIAKSEEANLIYDTGMRIVQEAYKALVHAGISVEEARGILPLHLLTRGTMCINLRALKGLIKNRVCFIMQGSYWFPVIEGMIQELSKHLPKKTLSSLVSLPCHGCDHCPIEGNVLHRISGDDPNPVCPIYIKRFEKNKEEVEAKERERHPNYEQIKEKYVGLLNVLGLMERGGDSVEG